MIPIYTLPMVAAVIAILVALLIQHRHRPSGRPAHISAEAAQSAALRIMGTVPECLSAWPTPEQADAVQRRIAELRIEYAAYEPAWMRPYFMGWLDWADRQLVRTRAEIEKNAEVQRALRQIKLEQSK